MAKKAPLKAAPLPTATAMPQVSSPKATPSLRFRLVILLLAMVALVYGNTLKNGFVYDDLSAITKNTLVTKGVPAIPELLSTPYRYGFWIVPNDTYRPLSLVLFAVEYQFFGKNPMPFHLVCVLLFAACVILVFRFAEKVLKLEQAVAFVAALLFAVHPIHTEVVANIKSCDELLCFLFAFLSIDRLSTFMNTGRTKQLFTGGLFFLLSILAKETGIAFLGVIWLVCFFYDNANPKRGRAISVTVAAKAGLSLIIRYIVLEKYHADVLAHIPVIDNALVMPGLPAATRFASAMLVMGYYLKLLLAPYPLICDYSYNHLPLVGLSDPIVLLSVAAYAGLLYLAISRFLKNHKDLLAFCIFYFMLMMALYSNLLIMIAATLGERFLFFPSVAFCIAVAYLLQRWVGGQGMALLRNPRVAGIVGVAAFACAVVAFKRNTEWVDNETLFRSDVARAPQSVKLNFLLGSELEQNGARAESDPAKQHAIRQEAISYLQKAVAIYPDYDDAQSELNGSFFRDGQFDSAAAHGLVSLKLNPRNAVTLNNMGGIYFNRKDYARTISYCEQAISIDPTVVDMYTNVAASFLTLGRNDSGIRYLYRAMAVDPAYNTTYIFLARVYRSMGQADSFRKYEAIAQKIDPGVKI